MMMEMMGLHLPGSSFVNANTPLRDSLTRAGVKRVLAMTALGKEYSPVGRMLDERVFVNGVVGLLATGDSTNHTIHLIAIAAAAGIRLEWSDFPVSIVRRLCAHGCFPPIKTPLNALSGISINRIML